MKLGLKIRDVDKGNGVSKREVEVYDVDTKETLERVYDVLFQADPFKSKLTITVINPELDLETEVDNAYTRRND